MQSTGRKPTFDADTEKELANCIGTLCQIGFSLTMGEILDHVADLYIEANEINASQFKNGKPWPDWFHAFMKKNNLSMKKAEMISAARKSVTANPL